MVFKEVIQKLITASSKRFNLFLTPANIRIISANNGNCVVVLQVRDEHSNTSGYLHSSFSASAVDTVGALALRTHPKMVEQLESKTPLFGVTTNMNILYLSQAEKGDRIRVEANTIDVVDRMATVQVRILDENTRSIRIESLIEYAIADS